MSAIGAANKSGTPRLLLPLSKHQDLIEQVFVLEVTLWISLWDWKELMC